VERLIAFLTIWHEQRGPQVRHTLVEQEPIRASETSPPRKDLQGEAGGRSTVADWATGWAGQRKVSVTGGGGGRSGRAGPFKSLPHDIAANCNLTASMTTSRLLQSAVNGKYTIADGYASEWLLPPRARLTKWVVPPETLFMLCCDKNNSSMRV
jgi:hypothetical protein